MQTTLETSVILKNLTLVEGDHNSIRPRYFTDSVIIFLAQVLQVLKLTIVFDYCEAKETYTRIWLLRG
jgi:hypothetical protein